MKKVIPIWIWAVILFLVIAVISVAVLYFNERNSAKVEIKENISPRNITLEENKTWHYVTNFIGTNAGVVYPITIKGDKFRLTYSVAQDEYRDVMTIFVIPADLIDTWGEKGIDEIIFNADKSVTISFSIMQEEGILPITLTPEEYNVYMGKGGQLTPAVEELRDWATEQRYENTGIIPNGVSAEYIQSLGERKMLRNNYSDFFLSMNTPTQTDISYVGAGDYYLRIDVDSVDSWTMLVEDFY